MIASHLRRLGLGMILALLSLLQGEQWLAALHGQESTEPFEEAVEEAMMLDPGPPPVAFTFQEMSLLIETRDDGLLITDVSAAASDEVLDPVTSRLLPLVAHSESRPAVLGQPGSRSCYVFFAALTVDGPALAAAQLEADDDGTDYDLTGIHAVQTSDGMPVPVPEGAALSAVNVTDPASDPDDPSLQILVAWHVDTETIRVQPLNWMAWESSDDPWHADEPAWSISLPEAVEATSGPLQLSMVAPLEDGEQRLILTLAVPRPPAEDDEDDEDGQGDDGASDEEAEVEPEDETSDERGDAADDDDRDSDGTEEDGEEEADEEDDGDDKEEEPAEESVATFDILTGSLSWPPLDMTAVEDLLVWDLLDTTGPMDGDFPEDVSAGDPHASLVLAPDHDVYLVYRTAAGGGVVWNRDASAAGGWGLSEVFALPGGAVRCPVMGFALGDWFPLDTVVTVNGLPMEERRVDRLIVLDTPLTGRLALRTAYGRARKTALARIPLAQKMLLGIIEGPPPVPIENLNIPRSSDYAFVPASGSTSFVTNQTGVTAFSAEMKGGLVVSLGSPVADLSAQGGYAGSFASTSTTVSMATQTCELKIQQLPDGRYTVQPYGLAILLGMNWTGYQYTMVDEEGEPIPGAPSFYHVFAVPDNVITAYPFVLPPGGVQPGNLMSYTREGRSDFDALTQASTMEFVYGDGRAETDDPGREIMRELGSKIPGLRDIPAEVLPPAPRAAIEALQGGIADADANTLPPMPRVSHLTNSWGLTSSTVTQFQRFATTEWNHGFYGSLEAKAGPKLDLPFVGESKTRFGVSLELSVTPDSRTDTSQIGISTEVHLRGNAREPGTYLYYTYYTYQLRENNEWCTNLLSDLVSTQFPAHPGERVLNQRLADMIDPNSQPWKITYVVTDYHRTDGESGGGGGGGPVTVTDPSGGQEGGENDNADAGSNGERIVYSPRRPFFSWLFGRR